MTVLLVRAAETVDADAPSLRAAGIEVDEDPYLRVTACTDAEAGTRARRLLATLERADWCIVTSAAGPRALCSIAGADAVRSAIDTASASGTRFAAVGPASAAALAALGAPRVLTPTTGEHTAVALLRAIDASAAGPGLAVLPRSSIADPHLPEALHARGWDVACEVVYETAPVTERPRSAAALADGAYTAVVLRSPSAVRAVLHWCGAIPAHTAVIAGGPTTAAAARRAGLTVAATSSGSTATAVVAAVRTAGERAS